MLDRVAVRWHWVVGGLALELIGAVVPAAYLWTQIRRQDLGGHLTAATVRLVWHGESHTGTGATILVVGAVLFAVGAVLTARPYVRRPVALFVAVPVAALAGVAVLGLAALILAALLSLGDIDLPDMDFGGSRKRKRSQENPPR